MEKVTRTEDRTPEDSLIVAFNRDNQVWKSCSDIGVLFPTMENQMVKRKRKDSLHRVL